MKYYYLPDSRDYVGNSMLWWKQDKCGYTTDIMKAHIFTEEEAKGQHECRETDIPWEKEYIDSKIKFHIDMQYCDPSEKGIKE